MTKVTHVVELDEVVIRFSGDSGDGMQLTGTLFSDTSALVGNDISTFPDYPAEIRAPQGTVGGVSGFQLNFGSNKIHTPGDYADVLLAMNPASLKANLRWVKSGGTIIVDIDSFNDKNFEKAGYTENPLAKLKSGDYNIIEVPITSLTKEALKDLGLDNKSIIRSKNIFSLGIVYWLFNHPLNFTEKYFDEKFKKNPAIVEANKIALHAGYNYAENLQYMPSFRVSPAKIEKGKYRNLNGNLATAWGLIAAAEKAKLQLFCGSYPITPATEILQELSARKDLGVRVMQCEDEIAGICTAIGASFAGNLAVTTTSGPGLALKAEAIGLAMMTELPLVIVNVQRGGPSTGLPTKTEQADLLQALYGRNGECPVVVLAASTPSNCFEFAYIACKIAVEHMTPVILLTDGFIANGSEAWKIPQMADLPEISAPFAKPEDAPFLPYLRNPETLVRKWAVPGMKGLEHRVGGLEKMDKTGTVSYVPENHQVMVNLRMEKLLKIKVPDLIIEGNTESDILLVGWGSTHGHLRTVLRNLEAEGKPVALAQFNYIFPLPANTLEVFSKYKRILVCELNMGQFASYLRMNYPSINFLQFNKVMGLPFTVAELTKKVEEVSKL